MFYPGGGRPKGRLNAKTIEVQRFCRSVCEDPEYRASVLQRARTNTLGSMEPVIWGYAYGKPKETVDLNVKVDDELSQLSTEALALRAEELVKRLHEAQDVEAQLAPFVEVLTPKSLIPACPDDTINVTPLRKDENSAVVEASNERRENCGVLCVDEESADFQASTTDQAKSDVVSVDEKTDCKNTGDVCVNEDRAGENGGFFSLLRKLGVKPHA